ncbi:MAG: type I methionyl aminopeptidase [Candidatus Paceibacterota bacterium]|jgi:methionyl aminopeptidase
MNIKSKSQIEKMRASGKILARVLLEARKLCIPGTKTIEIDNFIEKYIYSKNSIPSFKNFKGYPYSSCISINEEVVHTLPSERIIKEGDLVGLDVGVLHEGFHTDSAISFGVGKISSLDEKLLSVTKKALLNGISVIADNVKIGDVQARIQETIENAGFQVIRDLCGHGIGKKMQEPPSIPNIGRKGTGFTLKEGMTICLEPMAAIGTYKIALSDDDWSIVTLDGSHAAQFEHTILVTKTSADILTAID